MPLTNLTLLRRLSFTPPVSAIAVVIRSSGNASCAFWEAAYSHASDTTHLDCKTANISHFDPSSRSSSDGQYSTIDFHLLAEILAPVLTFLILLCILWWWCVRRRRHRKLLEAQLTTIASAFAPSQQEKSNPGKTDSVKASSDTRAGAFRKPELGANGAVGQNREFIRNELGGEERARGAELSNEDVVGMPPMEMDAYNGHQELSDGSKLSRVEQLETRERALAAREDAALRTREEVIRARELEVEELERQNSLVSPLTAIPR